mmetsp:Transcript_114271/g.210002  ORF Transcript_114271/g.210002 Transcript_114271/m.210002 type:complete len:213 (+) Transcript_114271:963-1601(+)
MPALATLGGERRAGTSLNLGWLIDESDSDGDLAAATESISAAGSAAPGTAAAAIAGVAAPAAGGGGRPGIGGGARAGNGETIGAPAACREAPVATASPLASVDFNCRALPLLPHREVSKADASSAARTTRSARWRSAAAAARSALACSLSAAAAARSAAARSRSATAAACSTVMPARSDCSDRLSTPMRDCTRLIAVRSSSKMRAISKKSFP